MRNRKTEQVLRKLARNAPGPAREVLHDLLLEEGRSAEMPVLLESPEKVEALRLAGLRKAFLAQARKDLKRFGTADITAMHLLKRAGDPCMAAVPLAALYEDDELLGVDHVSAEEIEDTTLDSLLDHAPLEVQYQIDERHQDDAFFESMEEARREED